MNCPHPEKRRYATKGQAVNAIRSPYRAGKGNPDMHAYRCDCGIWHIGHDAIHFGKRIKVAIKGRKTQRRKR